MTILVGYAPDERGKAGLQLASMLARSADVDLVVACVLPAPWVPGMARIDAEYREELERAADRIRQGTSVAVFPEGTRSSDATVRQFKRGTFVLAVAAGVPVVPVSLAGVKRIAPRGMLRMRPGTVRLTIHPAVATAGRDARDAAGLAGEVRDVVARACALEDGAA